MSPTRSTERPAAPTAARILDLDFIRGFMLISMSLNHGTSLCREMGRHAASPITIAQVLPSTTTEIFFLISGYLFGHVRLAKLTSVDRRFVGETLRRAWQLYCYNAVTLLLVAAMMGLAGQTLLTASRFDELVHDPITAVRDFMLMRSAPFGFDVLQLYAIFFLTTPLFAAVLMRWPAVALTWLVGCWLAVGVWSVAVGLDHDETIGINVWAWQITFFGGMMIGIGRRYGAIAAFIVGKPIVIRVAAILLAVFAFAWLGQKYPHRLGLGQEPWTIPGIDRAVLGPLKILCSLCVVVVMIWLSDRLRIAETRIGQALMMLGRHSLTCFCASNFGLYGVALAWQETSSHAVFWLAEGLFVVFILAWVALVDTVIPTDSGKRRQVVKPSASAPDTAAAAANWALPGHRPAGSVH